MARYYITTNRTTLPIPFWNLVDATEWFRFCVGWDYYAWVELKDDKGTRLERWLRDGTVTP
jgi:hypothetical protein